jgi:rubrerythrin
MIEGETSSYERIRSKTTLKEILEVATSFEESARNFYRDLAPKVSKNIRWLVDELAVEEQRHYDLFTDLAARDDIAGQIEQRIDTPATDGKFSDAIQLPNLGESPDDQAVLQYAMGREHTAMEHYRALAESAAPGPIQELFEFLANEETQHKAELEKLYYEIIHSGGV